MSRYIFVRNICSDIILLRMLSPHSTVIRTPNIRTVDYPKSINLCLLFSFNRYVVSHALGFIQNGVFHLLFCLPNTTRTPFKWLADTPKWIANHILMTFCREPQNYFDPLADLAKTNDLCMNHLARKVFALLAPLVDQGSVLLKE